jgi:hypothetical protein
VATICAMMVILHTAPPHVHKQYQVLVHLKNRWMDSYLEMWRGDGSSVKDFWWVINLFSPPVLLLSVRNVM